ncbi:unnamed protein product [Angiostrongylus costaricensis]|uniref:Uncharacterized protein n=1 Tax=Angiostrongylus costaricensis TaxID=334426 RepID=A0A0R3PQG5_ANGCS|nr:unnamed protein product [Angiostrongylus costaricensis]
MESRSPVRKKIIENASMPLKHIVVPSFCTGSNHRHLRENIMFRRKPERNPCRPRRKHQAAYNENILNEIQSKPDEQNKEDPTEYYELIVDKFKNCDDFLSIPQARNSDGISITTKELLENRKELKLDLIIYMML